MGNDLRDQDEMKIDVVRRSVAGAHHTETLVLRLGGIGSVNVKRLWLKPSIVNIEG